MPQTISAPVSTREYVIAHIDTNNDHAVNVGDYLVAKDRVYLIQEMTDDRVTLYSDGQECGRSSSVKVVERGKFDEFMQSLNIQTGTRYIDRDADGLSVGDMLIGRPLFYVPSQSSEPEGGRAAQAAAERKVQPLQCQTTFLITAVSPDSLSFRSATVCTEDLTGDVPPADFSQAEEITTSEYGLLIYFLQQ
jgi:hypothetical protein